MERNKVIRIFILFSCFFLIALLLFSSLSILGIRFTSQTKDEMKSETFQYQEFNPAKNELTFGYVDLRESVVKDDFLYYRNSETNNLVVISKFSSTSYECSGSCTCTRNQDDQRRSSSALSKSLYFLISASSTVLAVKIAEKAFQDQCTTAFSESCDPENIESEVSECSSEPVENSKPSSKQSNKPNEYRVEWSCTGHCSENTLLRDSENGRDVQKRWLQFGRCEDLRMDGKVVTTEIRENLKIYDNGGKERVWLGDKNFWAGNNAALRMFVVRDLDPYCRQVTKGSYVSSLGEKMESSMCVGSTSHRNERGRFRKAVRCFLDHDKIVGMLEKKNV